MAKIENAGVIEKHIEKIILGACVLLLLYGVTHWVLGSPRVVQVSPGTQLAPTETDVYILEQAEKAKKLNNNEEVPPYVASDDLAEIMILREGPDARLFVKISDGRLPLGTSTILKYDPIKTSLAMLEQRLPAPSVPYMRVTKEMLEPDSKLEDVNIARIITTYDYAAAMKAVQDQLKDKLVVNRMTAVVIEAELIAKQPGTEWDDAVIVPIKTARSPFEGRDAEGNAVMLTEIPTIPAYDGHNRPAVQAAIDQIADMQEQIFQPDFWWIQDSSGQLRDWRENLPQEPLEKIGAPLVDVQPQAGVGRTSSTYRRGSGSVTPPPRRVNTRTGTRRSPARRTSRSRRNPRMVTPPDMMPPDMPEPPGGGIEPPSAPGRRNTRTLNTSGAARRAAAARREAAEARRKAIEEKKRRQEELEEPKVAQVRQVPDFQTQLIDGKVLIWVHDPSLEAGVSYKGRVRVKFLNPLLMREMDLDESIVKDAKETVATSPWSAWSMVVRVPQETEFFLTTSIKSGFLGKSTDGKVGVTVFTRVLGQTVKHAFPLTRGQAIGAPQVKTVVNHNFEEGSEDPAKAERTRNITVDFSTGAVLVDIDFDKYVLRNNIPQKTAEITYLDGNGTLRKSVLVFHLPADSDSRKRYEHLDANTVKQAEALTANREM